MDWTPIWHQAAAPAFAMGFLAGKKKTVVYSVISQVSGEKLRIRFSNHYGKKPYTIGGLTVWAQGEMHTVTRDGSCVFTVPAGESCYSDALPLPVTMGGRAGNQTLLCIQGHGQQYDRGKCGKLPGKSYDGQRATPTPAGKVYGTVQPL